MQWKGAGDAWYGTTVNVYLSSEVANQDHTSALIDSRRGIHIGCPTSNASYIVGGNNSVFGSLGASITLQVSHVSHDSSSSLSFRDRRSESQHT